MDETVLKMAVSLSNGSTFASGRCKPGAAPRGGAMMQSGVDAIVSC